MCAERNEFWPYAIIEYRVERRENIWWHLHWNIENKQMIMGFCFDRKVTKWTESIPFRLIAWNCTLFQLCVYVEFRLVFWFRRVDSLGEIESRSTHTHTCTRANRVREMKIHTANAPRIVFSSWFQFSCNLLSFEIPTISLHTYSGY